MSGENIFRPKYSGTGEVYIGPPYFGEFLILECEPGHPGWILDRGAYLCSDDAVEVTTHGDAARLVPARDPDRMATALAELLGSPAVRLTLGARARAWILDNYGQSTMMRRYEDVYRAPRRGGSRPRR